MHHFDIKVGDVIEWKLDKSDLGPIIFLVTGPSVGGDVTQIRRFPVVYLKVHIDLGNTFPWLPSRAKRLHLVCHGT